MATERTCPSCGERVFDTDRECMACGKSLETVAPAPAKGQAAPAYPRAGPEVRIPPEMQARDGSFRPPMRLVWHQEVLRSAGAFWDLYPWLTLGVLVLTGVLGGIGAPHGLVAGMGALWALLNLGCIFWIVVDVIALQSGWFWVALFVFFGPLAFLAYVLWGRD